MADVKWIKIVTDIFDDEKIQLIETMPEADSIIVIWFKLLCLAGKSNNGGVFMLSDKIPYTDKMLAAIFRRKESTVQMALEYFQQFGMIEIIDGIITIPNWSKHQSLDAYEKKKIRDREYQRERREKAQKEITEKKSSDNRLTVGRDCSYSYSYSNNSNIDNLKYILDNGIYKDYIYINNNIYMRQALFDWMEYKDSKKPRTSNHYDSEIGIKKFLTQCVKCVKEYGEEVFVALVNESIANNYVGIIFDKADKIKVPKKPLLEAPKEEKEPEKELSGEEWEKMMSEMSDEEYEKMMSEWPDEKVV